MTQRYLRKKKIGHGLFSDIYLGEDSESGRVVALKVTEPMDERPPHNSRFELRLLQELDHCNVIKLLDQYEFGDELVMVLPLYDYTLKEMLKQNTKLRISVGGGYLKSNRLPLDKIKDICKSVISLIIHIHSQGIIHRDLKLENILIRDNEIVIADFGICWTAPNNFNREPVDAKFTDIATGIYKAPELIFGVANYTTAVDIWALGVILTELYSLEGESIITGESDISILSSIFEIFGTENISNWHEVSDIESFKCLNIAEHSGLATNLILARCNDDKILQCFNKMMCYESSQRLNATEVLEFFL